MKLRADSVDYPKRKSRFWPIVGALLGLDVVGFALAVHSVATYHARPDKPTVMPMGTLLMFIVCSLLLVMLGLISFARTRGEREWGPRDR